MSVFYLEGNLYNIVHGTNPYAEFLLSLLAIPRTQTGRFRDCYMSRADNGELEIHLYTRNGGGNRKDHEAVTAKLRQHPHYLRDFDSPADQTYAAYVFSVPEAVRDQLEESVRRDPESALPRSHGERNRAWEQLSQQQPKHPEVLRVQAVMKPTIDKLLAATTGRPNATVGLLDKD